MRRFALVLCAVFLLCAPVQALTIVGEASQSGVISQIAEMDREIIVLEQDEELTTSMLNPVGPYLSDDGTPYLLPMEWNVTAEDLLQPGLHLVTGSPLLAENMVLAEGFDPTLTWPIFRIGDGAVLEMASVALSGIPDVLIEQNEDPLQTLALSAKVVDSRTAEGWLLKTADRTDFYWQWDLSEIDSATLGSYMVTAELCHPGWVVFPGEYETITETVYVMPSDRIELYGGIRTSSDGALELSWVYDSSNVTEPILERKDETGQWVRCEESWYKFHAKEMTVYDYLYLYLLEMPTEVPLTLRLRYQDVLNGVTVERITEPITLTVPANIAELIAAANGRVVVNVIGGDRDGGDSGGTDLPDYEQPSPRPEAWYPVWRPEREETEESQKRITEIVTDTYTAISGTRLAQLVEMGPAVLFEKQGISVEIPSEILERLELDDDELLEVTIERQQHGVRIDVAARGTAVRQLGQTAVRLPWSPADGTDLEAIDANGFVIGAAVYEASSTAFFTIETPGTYWLRAIPAAELPVEEIEQTEEPSSEPAQVQETKPAEPIQEDESKEPAQQSSANTQPPKEPDAVDPAEPAQPTAAQTPERASVGRIILTVSLIAVLAAAAVVVTRRWRNG